MMIRKVEAGDKAHYVAMAQQFYNSDAVDHTIPVAYIEAAFDELMRSDVYLDGYMLEHEGEIAGYALIAKTFSSEGGGLTVWVEEAYVLSQFRSLGLGKSLFSFLEQTYGDALARIRLEIVPDNVRARALYEKLGFEILPYQQMVREFKTKAE